MRSFLILLALLVPASAEARLFEEWRFLSDADVDAWRSAGFTEARHEGDALVFDIEEEGVLYRPLPEGFHEQVDSVKVLLDTPNVRDVELVFVTSSGEEILKRFRLQLKLHETGEGQFAHVPLNVYRGSPGREGYIGGSDTLALHFTGTAEGVRFRGIEFHSSSPFERLIGAWRSFWTMKPFSPSVINLVVGPVVVPEIGRVGALGDEFSSYTSFNAYAMVILALLGVVLLVAAVVRAQRGGAWESVKRQHRLILLSVIAAVWLILDLRMGMEFLSNVREDHRKYIGAPEDTRTFRDRGRFYDFAAFVAPLVSGESVYEVMLPDRWPYYGNLRYLTYPAVPNADADPVSNVWVVYDRPEITVSSDGSLLHGDKAFTGKGKVAGWFGPGSFVFREEDKDTPPQ